MIAQANAAAETVLNMSFATLRRMTLDEAIALPPGYRQDSEAPFAAYDVDLGKSSRLHGDFAVTPFADRPGWRLVAIHGAATTYAMGHRLDRSNGARAAVGVAAMLAHEIKNPLSGIRGAAQLIESRADEDAARMTRLICSEVDRVATLVDQMEGFTDTRPLDLESANVHEIVDHVREVARNGFAAAVTFEDDFDPSLPMVLVNRDALIQVLLNLLKNAAEAGGTRTVTLTTAYRHGVAIAAADRAERRALPIELCVIDDGPGAPPELTEAMFEPFVSSKRTGRGLGLALADKLMRDMGGIIQYAREGDPLRTVFRLLLPRAGNC